MTILTNKYFIGFVVALAIVFSVLAYGSNQYDKGYNVAELKSQAEMLDFKNRLAIEATETIKRTQVAAQKSKDLQDKQIAELQQQKTNLENIVKENENEANTDVNRDRIGLELPSVMRLNKIK